MLDHQQGGVAMLKVGLVAMLEVESSNYRVVNRGGVLQSLPVCLLVSLPCALSSQTWHLYQQRNHLIYVPLEVEGIKLLGDQPVIISWVFKINNKLEGVWILKKFMMKTISRRTKARGGWLRGKDIIVQHDHDDQSCLRNKRRISRETRARRAWLRGAKIGGKDGALV